MFSKLQKFILQQQIFKMNVQINHLVNTEERIPSPKADQIELKKRKLIDKYNKIHKN